MGRHPRRRREEGGVITDRQEMLDIVYRTAVVDALAPLGVEHIDMPVTPERLWQAIRAAEQPVAA